MTDNERNQKDIFLESEADQWFFRNLASDIFDPAQDIVLRSVAHCALKANHVLEIGCGDGRRLQHLSDSLSATCYGVEPSKRGVEKCQAKGLNVQQGTADELKFKDGFFDIVILGFCLYLVDRSDLFKIAFECDRVTKDGGFVIVYDFYSYNSFANRYSHRDDLLSFKMDYSKLFSWNPSYTCIWHQVVDHSDPNKIPEKVQDQIAVTVLKRDLKKGWPQAGKDNF